MEPDITYSKKFKRLAGERRLLGAAARRRILNKIAKEAYMGGQLLAKHFLEEQTNPDSPSWEKYKKKHGYGSLPLKYKYNKIYKAIMSKTKMSIWFNKNKSAMVLGFPHKDFLNKNYYYMGAIQSGRKSYKGKFNYSKWTIMKSRTGDEDKVAEVAEQQIKLEVDKINRIQ